MFREDNVDIRVIYCMIAENYDFIKDEPMNS
jgi:hypothetical protein